MAAGMIARCEIPCRDGVMVVVLGELDAGRRTFFVSAAGGALDVTWNRLGLGLDEAVAWYGYVVESLVKLAKDGTL